MEYQHCKRIKVEESSSESKDSESLFHIPQEITDNILTRIPLKSLARFQSVCKRWYCSSISNITFQPQSVLCTFKSSEGQFFHTITNQGTSTEKFPVPWDDSDSGSSEVYVSNSCNGMVLICVGISFYLFNPSTHYFVRVLTLNCLVDYPMRKYRYKLYIGLYYDETISDYKAVVLIRHSCLICRQSCTDILIEASLKEKRWNHVDNTFEPYNEITVGPLVNGRLHWLYDEEIIRFNPVLKVFEESPSFQPPPSHTKLCAVVGIGFLIGCLCVFRIVNKHDVEILAMKEYGVSESWTPIFYFSNKRFDVFWNLNPLFFTRAGEILFSAVRNEIWVYNLGKKSLNKYKEISTCSVSFVQNMDTPTGYYWDQTEHANFGDTEDFGRIEKFWNTSQ